MEITIKHLTNEALAQEAQEQFAANGIMRREGYFRTCLDENYNGDRVTVLAFYQGALSGCGHLLKKSPYDHFRNQRIPEVNDLVVFPPYRRRGVGQALIHALEQLSRDLGYQTVGLGVGLYKDYGSAQRLYARLGYIPDGHGICAGGEPIDAGSHAVVDDELLMYWTKKLK